MNDIIVEALKSMVIDRDLKRDKEMAIELENGDVLYGRKGQFERPDVNEGELLDRVVGVDEFSTIILPDELEDGLVN